MNATQWTSALGASLPALVGREHELALAGDLLTRPEARVVVVRGPGGVGKTRLAQALLTELFPAFDLGGCFVNLAPLRGEGQLLAAIAGTLRRPFTGQTPLEALSSTVADRSILLVLDNLEHLPDTEADIAALCEWLPGARLLVTSRRVLRLRGVRELPLGPLPLPATPQQAAGSAAVQLFVQRAQDVDPDFALTDRNAAAVSAVCAALDGLPLALELAAARLRAVDLTGLLDWLHRPLEVLSDGPLDDPARQRSLGGAVRWSYDLLNATERQIFVACGAFTGSFTQRALEAVSGVQGARAALIALVDQSLIQAVGGAEPRWRLLEPVREFCAGELLVSPQGAQMARRHAQHFLELAEETAAPGAGATPEGLARLQADDANLRSALEHFIEQQATGHAQRLTAALFPFWMGRGHVAQGLALCARVLALPGPPETPQRAEMMAMAAMLSSRAGRHGDAEQWARDSLAVRRALGDAGEEAGALSVLADVVSSSGQYPPAIDLFRQALALAEAQGHAETQAYTLHNLAFSLDRAGEYGASLQHFDRALVLWRTLEQPLGEAYTSVVRARVALLRRDLHSGLPDLRRAWELGAGSGDTVFEEALTYVAALLAERTGRLPLAVCLTAASAEMGSRSEGRLPGGCERERAALAGDLRAAVSAAEFAAAWSAGLLAGPAEVAAHVTALLQDDLPAAPPPGIHLTPREREVLVQVAAGHTDKRIAQALQISAGTVGKHVASLLDKLAMHNRVELARWAVNHHLVQS